MRSEQFRQTLSRLLSVISIYLLNSLCSKTEGSLMAGTSSRSPLCDKRRGPTITAYLYRSRIYGGHEIAKRDNTNCKQMAAHESLQILEPRLLVAISVGTLHVRL